MIPSLAIVRIRPRQGRGFRLWIPLALLWIVLLPFAVLALPFFALYCAIGRINLGSALWTIAKIAGGLKGMHVDLEDARHSVSLHIA